MTTTNRWLALARKRLAAPLARFEERALGLRGFERLRVPTSAALTVICDDGELADLEIVDVLAQAGVRGVFAVSPCLIGRAGFMSYAQLLQLRDMGHEIAFHGTTHESFTRMHDDERLRATLRGGLKRLADEGLSASTLVYPYGRNNRRVRAAVAPLFDCAFTTWFGLNERLTNRYAIRRIPLGAYAGPPTLPESWYRQCLERAAAGDCWPTLMLHPGGAGHTGEHTAMLGRLLAHARELGLPVRTAKQHLTEAPLQGAAIGVGGPGTPVQPANPTGA
jgi:peptidoglycan/xylan/chitin deacetylase (PgdA/CDA1 family)